MANKEYYERWLKLKQHMNVAFEEDAHLQELAHSYIGVKPQATAVEVVARVYCKYCDIFNKLCEIYDQMGQAQRRPFIRKLIDTVTCRLLELKTTLSEVETFEYTYCDNALQQMMMTPHDVQVLCPFFYPFEIREQEMQYIIDEIFAGNRLGDPEPTPSELERIEEERLEDERIKKEEKDEEIKRKIALGEEIVDSMDLVVLRPEEQEELRLKVEYETHINNIQRMERSRVVIKAKVQKYYKDLDLFNELSGQKKKPVRVELKTKAAELIRLVYRKFMQLKRDHYKDLQMKQKLDMIIPSWSPVSAKDQLEKVKEVRRDFRKKYHEEWVQKYITEKARVLRIRQDDIVEDITDEIRGWLQEWYDAVRIFDEFPYADEGGSILIVCGQTFDLEEYKEWQDAEQRRLKIEAGNPKTKEQIKAIKLEAKMEKKRLAQDTRLREKKRIIEYKKNRMSPDNDPGVYVKIGRQFNPNQEVWNIHESQWKSIDVFDAQRDVHRRYIMDLIAENVYHDISLQLRPVADDLMRIEYKILKAALKQDYFRIGILNPLESKKRKKPKKQKPKKPEKLKPERVFQCLVDEGIIRQYPRTTLDDYWGDRNYAAADLRGVLWTPSFPPPGLGDVRELVRVNFLLALGSSCANANRAQLLVGPKGSGKRTLVYAIATETNSILIDLSPLNVYDKFPGPKNLKMMFTYVNKISRMLQPTVILVANVDKMFYKKIPKEEKEFDPTRLMKDFVKEIIKPLGRNDKILVVGTATEPWLARTPKLLKAFPAPIMLPRTDYASVSVVLSNALMKYHGVDREFDVHSTAQALRGYDINTIRKTIEAILSGERVAALYHKPLTPMELVTAVIENEGATYTDDFDMQMYKDWYLTFTPIGQMFAEYMVMLESQFQVKLKKDKKKKKKKA